MNADRVAVHGAGLAGLTCALLAARDGGAVTLVGGEPAGPPTELVLNEATVALLTSLWGEVDGHRLTGRWSRWGIDAGPVQTPSTALVVNEQRLVAVLAERLPDRVERAETAPPADWTIRASARPAGNPPVGRRVAITGYAPMSETRVSRMATTWRGWVQAVPLGDGRGFLRAVSPVPPDDPEDFLGAEIEAAGLDEWVVGPPERVVVAPAAPWLSRQRAEPGRLHVGGGVLRLDPLSGSGAGQAMRTAMLATAVVRDGRPAADLLGDYHRRLGAAFHRHLIGCTANYRTAFDSAEWAGELHITATALAGHAAQLHSRSGGPVFTGRRDVAAMT
ncbi:hypothetical protein Q0Z83_032900 [Actinoplanes sichuanensis]|uniref:Dehydrogenase (Flavoprotein) n=1 Tax=Actinoplanes sichuanensis TaxID=512349 RepID=A0ABW4A669_9ACTN|nr:hypothetical protein [Actinoplanes sichuanensis]BEL05099.1 hypothetical protein Q0Z83_032900 [Actinoplanes sichuanensis]